MKGLSDLLWASWVNFCTASLAPPCSISLASARRVLIWPEPVSTTVNQYAALKWAASPGPYMLSQDSDCHSRLAFSLLVIRDDTDRHPEIELFKNFRNIAKHAAAERFDIFKVRIKLDVLLIWPLRHASMYVHTTSS